MSIKDISKSSGPLRFLSEHVGPNRAKRRREMAVKIKPKRPFVHKLTTAQARRRRKEIKHRRKQGRGLRKP